MGIKVKTMSVSNQDMAQIDTSEKSKTNLSHSERIWTFTHRFNGSRSPLLCYFFPPVSAAFKEISRNLNTLKCFIIIIIYYFHRITD